MPRWWFLISSLQSVPAPTCCMTLFCTGAHPSKSLDRYTCLPEYQDGLFLPLEDAVLYWPVHRLSLSQLPFPWNSSTDLSCPVTEIALPLLVFPLVHISNCVSHPHTPQLLLIQRFLTRWAKVLARMPFLCFVRWILSPPRSAQLSERVMKAKSLSLTPVRGCKILICKIHLFLL